MPSRQALHAGKGQSQVSKWHAHGTARVVWLTGFGLPISLILLHASPIGGIQELVFMVVSLMT